MAISRNSELAK